MTVAGATPLAAEEPLLARKGRGRDVMVNRSLDAEERTARL